MMSPHSELSVLMELEVRSLLHTAHILCIKEALLPLGSLTLP